MQILVFAIGILLFIGLILVHEWGHYIVARRNGVDAEEFGLFFPPRLWSRKLKSGMLLSINALPLGGFVKLKGENDSDTRKGSLGAASLGKKSKIMLAGVTMNLLAGLLILTVLAWIGMPKLISKDSVGEEQFTVASDTHVTHQQVLAGQVLKGTPADKIGLKNTYTILSIAGGGKTYQIKTTKQLHDATNALAGQPVSITYMKGPKDKQVVTKQVELLDLAGITSDLKKQAGLKPSDSVTSVTDISYTFKDQSLQTTNVSSPNDFYTAALRYAGDKSKITYLRDGQGRTATATLNPKAYLGVAPNQLQIQRSTWSAPIVAVGLTGQVFKITFVGLGHALGGLGSAIAGLVTHNHQARENGQTQASDQVGGPVAIGVALWDYGSLGINFMLFLIALISLTLALMNALPIPALDGGRLAMMLVSRGIFHKPLTRAMEERIVGASFVFLIALVVLITVVDVKRFF